MNSRVFNQIIQLNKDFYKAVGEDFSRTRQAPWTGWVRLLDELRPFFESGKKIKIADLGCGNGRFLKFLLDNNFSNFEYHGFDSDDYLLSSPITDYDLSDVYFKKLDVLLDLDEIAEKFDLIVAFGLVHHIPSQAFRKKWFSQVVSKLNSNGIFVFTTWNPQRDEKFKPLGHELSSEIENNDYFLGWDNKKDVYRYVHIYSEDEVKGLLGQSRLIFTDDGKTRNQNNYYLSGPEDI